MSSSTNKSTNVSINNSRPNKSEKKSKYLDNRGFSTVSIKPKEIIIEVETKKIPIVEERKCIICIRGHVDTGKTSFISLLSSHTTDEVGTQLNDAEAGSITQQVGTKTFRREDLIKFIPDLLQEKFNMDFVTIDTPGHASFENIRLIGLSISHIRLIFVDIVKGIDEDTLNYLEENILTRSDYENTIIVLNKMDKIYGFNPIGFGNLKKVLNKQTEHYNELLDNYYTNIIKQLSSRGLYGEPYHRKRQAECIPMIPISAKNGDGVPDLLLYMSNTRMKLERPINSIGYIIDKRNDSKYGKVIIGIMKYGSISSSNAIKIGSSTYPIKQLLQSGNHDSREQHFEPTEYSDEATAFAVVVDQTSYNMIEIGSSFEPISGVGIKSASIDDSAYETFVARKSKLLSDIGVYVVIPSESMIDGVHEYFTSQNIPIAGYSIGSTTKADIIKFVNKFKTYQEEYNSRYKCIMCCLPDMVDDVDEKQLYKTIFDEEKLNILKHENFTLLFGGTIYKLANEYTKYSDKCKQEFIDKYGQYASFEAETIPKFIFRTSDPILCGITVKSGIIRIGTKVTDIKGFKYGTIDSIKLLDKDVTYANEGSEVCIKIVGGSITLDKKNKYVFKNEDKNETSLVTKDVKYIIKKK
jgi:translation initiation factor 5B